MRIFQPGSGANSTLSWTALQWFECEANSVELRPSVCLWCRTLCVHWDLSSDMKSGDMNQVEIRHSQSRPVGCWSSDPPDSKWDQRQVRCLKCGCRFPLMWPDHLKTESVCPRPHAPRKQVSVWVRLTGYFWLLKWSEATVLTWQRRRTRVWRWKWPRQPGTTRWGNPAYWAGNPSGGCERLTDVWPPGRLLENRRRDV